MKHSNDTIGNQTRDLPICSAVPQPTAPHGLIIIIIKFLCILSACLLSCSCSEAVIIEPLLVILLLLLELLSLLLRLPPPPPPPPTPEQQIWTEEGLRDKTQDNSAL